MSPEQGSPTWRVRLMGWVGFVVGAWALALRDSALAAPPVLGLYFLLGEHLPPLGPLEVIGFVALARFFLMRIR